MSMSLLSTLSVFLEANAMDTQALVSVLRAAADPVFAGAQVVVPIVVVLVGIHKLVDHRTEHHAVLLAELFGFIIVMEGAVVALKKVAGI
jgi:hypothetical protein